MAGTCGTSGSTEGAGTYALFNAPTFIAYDKDFGALYASDTGNKTIRKLPSVP